MRPRRCMVPVFLLIAAAGGLMLAAASWAREVVVTRHNGHQVRGQLVANTAESVTVSRGGNDVIIPRDQVRSVEPVITPQEVYEQKRKALADDDLEKRYELAYWLFDEKLFELSLNELQDLSKRFPDDQRVAKLIPIVQNRLNLRQRSTDRSSAGAKDRRPVKSVDKKRPAERGWPANRLSREQINLIRVFEIDLTKRPVVVVPPKVIDEVFKYYADGQLLGETERRKFKGRKGWQQLEQMFELVRDNPQIRSLYKQVKVRDDPPAMRTFRTRIHRHYGLNYCGTAGCHGGEEAGSLQFFRERPTHIATVYTNFFMLDSFKAKSRYDMIDRENPDRSLLIQYALPAADALEPHPQVKGWKPLLKPQRGDRRDRRAQMVIDWINSLQKLSTNYMIEFKPAKQEQKRDGPDKPKAKPDADKATPVR